MTPLKNRTDIRKHVEYYFLVCYNNEIVNGLRENCGYYK